MFNTQLSTLKERERISSLLTCKFQLLPLVLLLLGCVHPMRLAIALLLFSVACDIAALGWALTSQTESAGFLAGDNYASL